MSHNLTQPEEVDHVLMAMAGHDMGTDTPIPDDAQSHITRRDAERDKSAQHPSDPLPYVWGM